MTDPTRVGESPALATLQERLEQKGVPVYDGDYPATETAEEKADRLERAKLAARNRWVARLPVMYTSANVSELDAAQDPDTIRSWLHDPAARNLILAGAVGTGKTHAAYALGNLLVSQGHTVEAWTVHDLLEALRPSGDDAPGAPKVDVLLLDDLGAGKPTEWAMENLTALLDERLRQERRTIVTTNLTADQIAEAWGPRFLDRLRYQSTVVVFRGESRRVAAW